jgi:hypothetical protein
MNAALPRIDLQDSVSFPAKGAPFIDNTQRRPDCVADLP